MIDEAFDGGMTMESRFDYFLCRHGHKPVEINIFQYTDPFDDVCLTYWVRVLRELEPLLNAKDLVFYIVWDSETVRELPSYGKNVVVLLLMEEFCDIPPYFDKVLYVFKTYGFYPYVNASQRKLSVALMVKAIRDAGRWVCRSGLQAVLHGSAIAREEGGMVVPLGYARQTDLPGKPFAERRYTISFIGSVKQRAYHPVSLRALLGTPKDIARSRMLDELRQLAVGMPDEVFWADTGSYMDGILSDGVRYSELMADSKICLAPRGSSTETFRMFEGMRQGCVVICDRVPRHWFFEDCPFIQLDDWAELGPCVNALLSDPERLVELHRSTLDWWERRCSAPALAGVMANRLSRATQAGRVIEDAGEASELELQV
ncbi:hypothetical protein DWF00_10315 [Bosea caraganae]|uniref:Exostosin GT47 domain-containing protein n=1 Tax=Bosea caraganae TaxID=2763117 RepID=A0A370LCW7_9HYPH|nr:hypothetical protein DWF00_10315 [Bosea caraganae]RDJ29365.1 hypothetical protein DWE98_02085 [Bosea caraganae]